MVRKDSRKRSLLISLILRMGVLMTGPGPPVGRDLISEAGV